MEGVPNKSEAEIVAELRAVLNDKLNAAPKGKVFEVYDRIVEYANGLKAEIPMEELETTRLWHLLIGSTIPEGYATTFDLAGGRIERFIRDEL